jgi:5-methylcytosine-specific restriction protein A
MALADLTYAYAVLRALEEFDRLGREEFLARYGFEKARRYFLVRNGQRYDSKAIAGVAHGYQHPERGPLRAADFSGGDATVRARLEALGFDVVVNEPPVGPVRPLRLFEDYSRREVHDIFAANIPFTPGAGI